VIFTVVVTGEKSLTGEGTLAICAAVEVGMMAVLPASQFAT
jgi:hypothetical protein